VHGLAEHCGRYANLVSHLVAWGYGVYAYDAMGHGKSEGRMCYFDRFSDFVADLEVFHDLLRKSGVQGKVFLLGHSTGGTVATAYASGHQDGLAGLILSSPFLSPGESVTWVQVQAARILSIILPRAGVAAINVSTLSRDQSVVDAYVSDRLVYTGKICARPGMELLRSQKDAPAQMERITVPLLLMIGTADRLSNPQGSEAVFNLAKSADKTLKRYDGFYHELFNEPERELVFGDLQAWLAAHL
jgi:alpha-beta hydrolase superfamily lysophospholipase